MTLAKVKGELITCVEKAGVFSLRIPVSILSLFFSEEL